MIRDAKAEIKELVDNPRGGSAGRRTECTGATTDAVMLSMRSSE